MQPSLVLYAALAGFAGFLLGYLLRRYVAEARIKSAEEAARRIIEEAAKEVEAKKREAIVEAKEESLRLKREAEREIREQRAEMQRLERRLEQREESLERKSEALENRERTLTEKEQDLARARDEAQAQQARHQQELERVSGLTTEQAREPLPRPVGESTGAFTRAASRRWWRSRSANWISGSVKRGSGRPLRRGCTACTRKRSNKWAGSDFGTPTGRTSWRTPWRSPSCRG